MRWCSQFGGGWLASSGGERRSDGSDGDETRESENPTAAARLLWLRREKGQAMCSCLLATAKQLTSAMGTPRNGRKDAGSELLATLLDLELITEMPLTLFFKLLKIFQ
jgi:hypothetical protein